MVSLDLPVLVAEATATALFQFVCVSLVSLFIVFCCIPRLHVPVREVVRPFVVYHVEGGLSWVAFAQRFQNPLLTKVFKNSSHSVSVAFYGSALPIVIWLGAPQLGWHLVVLMALTIYVGNAMKDLVSAPRPFMLPYGQARLLAMGSGDEDLNAKEYGLPSSHTMNSLCLNFYACHYLHEHAIISDNLAVLMYGMVMLWVIWIASSRLYLGLHTPIDILAGAVAGLTVVTTFISLENIINAWVVDPFLAIPSAALISLVLLRLHPRPMNPTPTFEFSTSIIGVMIGVIAGVSRCGFFFSPPVQLAAVWSQPPLWIARRLIAGFTLVLVVKELSRAAAHAILPWLYLGFPTTLRRMWQPPVHNQYKPHLIRRQSLRGLPHSPKGVPFDVEVTSRYFAYAGIGFAVCELAPRLFQVLDW